MSLETEFTDALHGTYEVARKRGYVATYFLQMLEEHGGVETTKRLLSKPDAQMGLSRLWELGLLHESMEAVIWDHTRFHPLFTSAEIEEVHQRLDAFEYFKKRR